MLHVLELGVTLCAQAERTPHRGSAGASQSHRKPEGVKGKSEGPPGDAEGPFRAHRAGWGGRIRTFDLLIQSQAPYRLATPQQCRPMLPDHP